LDQNQPISPCNGDAISASVRIMARSLQHRRVAWMHDFRDSPTRRSSHSTNPEVERRRPRRDTAPPNFRVFKVNQPGRVLCEPRRTVRKKKEGHHREETDQHRIHRRRPVHLLVESEQLIFGGSRWPSARGLSDVAETCDAGVTWRGG